MSVVHGDAESADDETLIFGVLPRLAQEAGLFTSTRSGNDYTTWFFDTDPEPSSLWETLSPPPHPERRKPAAGTVPAALRQNQEHPAPGSRLR